MAEYTPLGLAVKTKLLGPPVRSQAWLIAEVNKDAGMKVDSAYMSKILTGQRRSARVEASVRKILNIAAGQSQPNGDDRRSI